MATGPSRLARGNSYWLSSILILLLALLFSPPHARAAEPPECLLRLDSASPLRILDSRPADIRIEGQCFTARTSFMPLSGGVHTVASLELPESPATVRVFDGMAYVLGRWFDARGRLASALWLVDVHDPLAPRLRGSLDIDFIIAPYAVGGWADVAVHQGHAYLVSSTLTVVDVRNPDFPVKIRNLETGHATGIVVSGPVAYVASWRGLQILDLSDPSSPVLLETLSPDRVFEDVVLMGNLMVASSGREILAYDVSDPWSPAMTAILDGFSGSGVTTHQLVASGPWLAVGGSGPSVVDFTDPDSPQRVHDYNFTSMLGMAASGSDLYFSDSRGRFGSLDLMHPGSPFKSVATGPGYPTDLFIRGGFLFGASGDASYRSNLLNVHDIRLAAETTGSGPPLDIAMAHIVLDGDVAFGLSPRRAPDRLVALDISEPVQPQVLSLLPLGQASADEPTRFDGRGMDRDLDRLVIAGFETRGYFSARPQILVADIGTPDHPTIVGRLDPPWISGPEVDALLETSLSLVTVDAAAYLGLGEELWVIDISRPSSPALVSIQEMPAPTRALTLVKGHLYVASPAGTEILDLRDPLDPTHAGRTDESISGVALSGAHPMVSVEGDLWVASLSSPASPRLETRILDDGFHYGLLEANEGAFAVGSTGDYLSALGLGPARVMDISEPSRPALRLAGAAYDMGSSDAAIVGDSLLVTSFSDGRFRQVRLNPPVKPALVLGPTDALLSLPAGLSPGSYQLYAWSESSRPSFLGDLLMVATDADGDGSGADVDCDDADPLVHPGAPELPGNHIDENCDGSLGACDPCLSWRHHGDFVGCVAHEVANLVTDHVLTGREGSELISAAARSSAGKGGATPSVCQLRSR